MLRGQPRFSLTVVGGASSLPPSDSAFATEPERPAGIRFYRARESFFLPYSLLQSMQWRGELITLTFVHDAVTLTGQGLHSLYVQLAEFKVASVREQADDADADSESRVHVKKIQRTPRDSPTAAR